jgi:hypothetical protein
MNTDSQPPSLRDERDSDAQAPPVRGMREKGWFGRTFGSIASGFATAVELVKALWSGPYWWLVPVAALLLPAAILFVFLQAVPLVAPFVYTVL